MIPTLILSWQDVDVTDQPEPLYSVKKPSNVHGVPEGG